MLRPGRHNLVEIGPETEAAVSVRTFRIDFDGEERCILDGDAATLDRGDQPIAAIILAAQNGSKELDEPLPRDRSAAIKPRAVAGDPHVEIAVIDSRRPLAATRLPRRGTTGRGNIGQGRFSRCRL